VHHEVGDRTPGDQIVEKLARRAGQGRQAAASGLAGARGDIDVVPLIEQRVHKRDERV
jgi:hypothetical protein